MGKHYYNYNWQEIQEYYDKNHTIAEVDNKFGCGYKSRKKAKDAGLFILRDKYNQQITRNTSVLEITRMKEIAKMYNSGMSARDLYKSGVTLTEYKYARDNGYITVRSLSDAAKLRIERKGTSAMSEEAKIRQSMRMTKHNPGGKSKWFEVNGIKVQGTWERDFALFLNNINIQWQRPKYLEYTKEGKVHRYTPDFYIPDKDVYVEIKGYWWGDDRLKMDLVIKQHHDKEFIIIEDTNFASVAQLVEHLPEK